MAPLPNSCSAGIARPLEFSWPLDCRATTCSADIARPLEFSWTLDCRATTCSAGITRPLEFSWALDCRATTGSAGIARPLEFSWTLDCRATTALLQTSLSVARVRTLRDKRENNVLASQPIHRGDRQSSATERRRPTHCLLSVPSPTRIAESISQ
jgi:hypothetical protein